MSDRTETSTYVALGVGTGSAILGTFGLSGESDALYRRAAEVRPQVVIPAGSNILEPRSTYRTACFTPQTYDAFSAQERAQRNAERLKARLNRNARLASRATYLFGAAALCLTGLLIYNLVLDRVSQYPESFYHGPT